MSQIYPLCRQVQQHPGSQHTLSAGKYISTQVPNIASLQTSIAAHRFPVYLPSRQV
ncbi:hypothetical protein DPMN_048959 [Dreissena polymorpha]|uniref:Uncharacterized protein n=1 Tax=Dreissena polymorpha TaxID=45954 RepID=A0A9D4I3D9_DREPO|nr:hypothetical protein DPMN_048959 [Dreissena polymorpha]